MVVKATVTVATMALDVRLTVTVMISGNGVASNVTVMGVTSAGDGEQAVTMFDHMVVGRDVDLGDGEVGDRRLMHAHYNL